MPSNTATPLSVCLPAFLTVNPPGYPLVLAQANPVAVSKSKQQLVAKLAEVQWVYSARMMASYLAQLFSIGYTAKVSTLLGTDAAT